MITRKDLLTSPEYWFEDAQNELYRQVIMYMEKSGMNQNQLAKKLGVSKGYVSQILKGEFNYTLKKLIEISIAVGKVPIIEFKSFDRVLADDQRTSQSHSLPRPDGRSRKPAVIQKQKRTV